MSDSFSPPPVVSSVFFVVFVKFPPKGTIGTGLLLPKGPSFSLPDRIGISLGLFVGIGTKKLNSCYTKQKEVIC
jgi:hypothetical protein